MRILSSFILGSVILTITTAGNGIDAQSSSQIRRVLACVGHPVDEQDVKFQRTAKIGKYQTNEFLVRLSGSVTASAHHNESTGLINLATGIEFARSKRAFAPSGRHWNSESAARAALKSMLENVAQNHPATLQDFSISEDRELKLRGASTTAVGVASAALELTFSGYPQVDGFRGYRLKLATKDGALISLRGGLKGLIRGSNASTLTEAQARSRLAESLSLSASQIQALKARKGWATPKGADSAIIAFRFQKDGSFSPKSDAVYVESTSGGRVWRHR